MRLSNIGWNLAGLSFPLFVAIATVPHLIATLGNERFGFLALAWGLVGYAGALDLGIGRALTQMVARLRGMGDTSSAPAILATASRITLVSGAVGGALIALLSPFITTTWISVDDTPIAEIRLATLLMGVALPAQAMSATYRGLNEAYENFKGISILRIALGALNFGGPFLVSFHTHNVAALVGTIVVSRLTALAIYRHLALACLVDAAADRFVYSSAIARRLVTFGGWVTISSIVSPMLVQADRFFIGAIISISAVTIYVLPYEVVVQSLILVGAISTVAFPSFTREMAYASASVWPPSFSTWLARVAALMFTVCSLIAFLLPYALPLWIKDNLDSTSIVVGQILCIGVFANSLGSMFYLLLHAKGLAHVTARIHLLELPLYLLALVIFVPRFGVIGAAAVWVARMAIDTAVLAWASRRP